ncbi:MAG TPA: hypothetical protein VKD46_09770 [bacterium]|nr:hypothetical protein [bacterium]
MEMTNIKRILIAATLLLSLVGGAGQASADPGNGGTTTSTSVTVSGFGVTLTAGATWED